MVRTPTHLLTASVVVAALFGVAAVDPKSWRGNSLEGVPEDPESKETRILLERRGETVNLRIARKDALLEDLIHGYRSLVQVADEFVELDMLAPTYIDLIRAQYPGSTDVERAANMVFEYIPAKQLPRDVEVRVLTRLRHEYEAAFGHPTASTVH
ncbi:hypothetical protein [Fimbriiglobus ruber]|uniref:Uncharacterized protein n=1 Tax=Fimbriiglobus ruber TaxID=1908690 RepID=A0A225D0G1_9BACT|nr:hypothetical protein [Fimbriiglobus ruber]OWK34423.1 hypothetical protein FRUB_10394 [Fimbriiglobus ruber]